MLLSAKCITILSHLILKVTLSPHFMGWKRRFRSQVICMGVFDNISAAPTICAAKGC